MKNEADTAAGLSARPGSGACHGGGGSHWGPDTFTRTIDGQITSWSRCMERRYGFTQTEALGQVSHRLLRTIFPRPLQDIEATFLNELSWQGGLINRHANGKAIIVMSSWNLDRSGDEQGPVVTETHAHTITIQLADLLTILANELSQPLTAISNYVSGVQRSLQGDRQDRETVCKAMAMAADQIVRSTEQVKMLRGLADDLRHPGGSMPPPIRPDNDPGSAPLRMDAL